MPHDDDDDATDPAAHEPGPDDEARPGDARSGDDADSPGRSLLDDDDEIVEPNEPG
jgi:hypothetical protein